MSFDSVQIGQSVEFDRTYRVIEIDRLNRVVRIAHYAGDRTRPFNIHLWTMHGVIAEDIALRWVWDEDRQVWTILGDTGFGRNRHHIGSVERSERPADCPF